MHNNMANYFDEHGVDMGVDRYKAEATIEEVVADIRDTMERNGYAFATFTRDGFEYYITADEYEANEIEEW